MNAADAIIDILRDEFGAPVSQAAHVANRIILAAAPKVANDTDAAASEAGEVAIQSLVSAWHGGWSYEFGPHNVPNGPIEVAFDAGLGFTHVKICERFITRSMATYDRPLPVDQYEYGYRDQNGKDVSDSCRRPARSRSGDGGADTQR